MQNILRRNILGKSKRLLCTLQKFHSTSIFKNKILTGGYTLQAPSFNVKNSGFVKCSKFNFTEEKKSENKSEEPKSENKTEEQENPKEEEESDARAEYKTSRKIRNVFGKLIKYSLILGGLLTLYNLFLFKKKEDPSTHRGYVPILNKLVKNMQRFWFLTYGSLTLPYHEKILPDLLELQGQPGKKTLVVNLNKTLINYEYKFGSGFEILKRPGLLKFLQEMGQNYELVIFGTEDSNFVEEVCSKLDQFDMNIRYKLGKEATRLVNGEYVKDLYFLNRDLRNVVCIDFNPNNVAFNPHNVVIIPEFRGDGKDRELLQSIVFLKELSKPEVKDVRKELEKYGNFRPYIKFYKSDPKYKRLLPREETESVTDDADLQAIRNKK